MSAKTCSISGLAIPPGTPVRYFLLTKNPYPDYVGSRACYTHHWWFPRTFPLRAIHDDYGRVYSALAGIQQALWLEGLKLDLVSKGVGENPIHDVPVSSSMTFDQLQDGLLEGRVAVQRQYDRMTLKERRAGSKTPPGVPTRQRVQKCLVKAGLPLHLVDQKSGFAIRNKTYGAIRVRWEGDGADGPWQTKAQAALGEFTTALVAGRYPGDVDLMVFPKPGTVDYYAVDNRTPKSLLPLAVGMIREDVWQALLGMSIGDPWSSSPPATIDTFRKDIRRIYKKIAAALKGADANVPALRNVRSLMMELDPDSTVVGFMVSKDEVPFTVGLAKHFQLFCDKGLSMGEAEPFLDVIAEFAFIHLAGMMARRMWVPASSAGPSDGDFDFHKAFLTALLGIAGRDADKWHERNDDTLADIQEARAKKSKR